MDACTLYLDPSGDPGWQFPFGRSNTQWYIDSGLVLTTEQDIKASNGTARILQKYIPENIQSQYPDNYYEIHYNEIINGRNIYSHLKPLQRKDLSDEIFNFLIDLNPVLFATAINKNQLKFVYGSNAYEPRGLAMRATIHRFSIYLERIKKVGSVIVDSEQFRKDKDLQLMVQAFKRHGITLRGSSYQPMLENKLRNVLNTISFTPSHLSPGIQLADVCSKSIFLHFERGRSNRYHQIEPMFDGTSSRKYEPSIFPSPNKWYKLEHEGKVE